MPGPDRHAVDQELAQLADDARGVVLRARRRAGVDHDHRVLLQGGGDAVSNERAIVHSDWQAGGLAAPLADLAGQEHRVEVDDGAWLE